MKYNRLKKIAAISTIVLASSGLATVAQADELSALAQAGVKAYNDSAYQVDQYLNQYLTTNMANQNAKQQLNSNVEKQTLQNTAFNLQSIPDSILSTGSNAENSNQISKRLRARGNLLNQLTIGTPASDTLYSNNPSVVAVQFQPGMPQFSVAKPKTLDDDYFNIASVLNPVSYTAQQQTAAKFYGMYLTQNYSFPSEAIDLNALKSKLSGQNAQHQYQMLRQFITNPKYQKYQLTVRSNTATNSVIANNLGYLTTERTPVQNLGKRAGVVDTQGHSVNNASPLQVEKYIATHRVNDPKWYQHVQAASPATVQRETLVVLAEIENQNYQAHLDRERLLATLTALQANMGQTSKMLEKTQTQSVNSVIKNLGSNNNDEGSSTSAQAQKAIANMNDNSG